MIDHNESGTMSSVRVFRLLFPDLGLTKFSGAESITAEQWISAFHALASLSFEELCDRLRAVAPIMQKETGEHGDDDYVIETARCLLDFLAELKPVIADVKHGGRLIITSDSADVEDDELIRRADNHIDRLRVSPLFRKPLNTE